MSVQRRPDQDFSPSREHCNPEHWEVSHCSGHWVRNECPEESRNTSVEDTNGLGSFLLHLVPYWEGIGCVARPELLWKGEETWKGIWTWKVSESLPESNVFNLEEPEVFFFFNCYFFLLHYAVCTIFIPQPGTDPKPPAAEAWSLNPGPPEKPWAWVISHWKI